MSIDWPDIFIIFGIFLLVGVILIWGLIVYIKWRFFRFGKKFVDTIIAHILDSVRGLPATQKVLEYDKVLDKVLGQAGYKGSLWEKMKQHASSFVDQDAIWKAHKERNKVAHEMGYSLSEKQANKIAQVYESEISNLLKKKIK